MGWNHQPVFHVRYPDADLWSSSDSWLKVVFFGQGWDSLTITYDDGPGKFEVFDTVQGLSSICSSTSQVGSNKCFDLCLEAQSHRVTAWSEEVIYPETRCIFWFQSSRCFCGWKWVRKTQAIPRSSWRSVCSCGKIWSDCAYSAQASPSSQAWSTACVATACRCWSLYIPNVTHLKIPEKPEESMRNCLRHYLWKRKNDQNPSCCQGLWNNVWIPKKM